MGILELAVNENAFSQRWRKGLVALIDCGLERRRNSREPFVAMPLLTDFLSVGEATLLGQHSVYGTIAVFLDSFFDAASHQFPDVGDGLQIEEGYELVKEIRQNLMQDRAILPEKVQSFSKYLPYRP